MRARRGLRRGQGDSESRTRHEEGLKGSRALAEMWAGSLVGAEGRRDQPELQEWREDLRKREELSEGLRNS